MKKTAIATLLGTALLLSACGQQGKEASAPKEAAKEAPKEAAGHGNHGGGASEAPKSAEVVASFKLMPEKPQAQKDAPLTIQITDKNNKPVENFDITHEKKLHLIVVSKDLSFFNHIHPDYKGGGRFDITTQFPGGGDYKLIADFVPTGQGAATKTAWISVQGKAPAAVAIEPESKLVKTVDGKEVTLAIDNLKAGMDANLTFTIRDAASKQPVTNLQPYLGAVGHVVILSDDAEQYLHVHPMDEKASGPDAKFMTKFPKSGIYKLWGQFQHEGKVFTVPFVVKVP
ncbi:hypothetical protein NLX71_07095 [Paenibacillus sp. MZ04-78.2]|uniref:hypothetical protein n=1 Tax=Paenibacillus sp. MZ04-78.2 TaxID=2962034 RepID=UPI0020B8C7BB|nr:hypothetical protein [Paenibacillus sp. MZ04-78.2]MCP3773086.1 hypothetical protein [Paenibacillus sp. MZ04-78.2]